MGQLIKPNFLCLAACTILIAILKFCPITMIFPGALL